MAFSLTGKLLSPQHAVLHEKAIDVPFYFDAKSMENNRRPGITYSDDDLLQFVRNIYAVLLTRGIRGTYVYVCDRALREFLSSFIGKADISNG